MTEEEITRVNKVSFERHRREQTTPKPTPPLPLEEQIARVIAPTAYWGDPDTNAEQQDALTKARQIIALFPKGGSGEAEPLVQLGRDLASDLEQGHWSMADAVQMIRGLCDRLAAHPAPKDRGEGLREYRLDLDRKGQIDDLSYHGHAHLERMNAGTFYLGLYDNNKGGLQIWLSAKRDKLEVHFETIDRPLAASPSPRDKAGEGRLQLAGIVAELQAAFDHQRQVYTERGEANRLFELPDLREADFAALLIALAAPRDKALVEEGGLREALEQIIADAEATMTGRTSKLNNIIRYAKWALAALSTKDMGLSRDLSQTADAACEPDGSALIPGQVAP